MQNRKLGSAAPAVIAAALLCAGCQCKLLPIGLEVDPSLTGNSDANGMLEPFETVDIEPTWEQKVTKHCKLGPSDSLQCTGTPGDFTCKTNLTEKGTAVSLTGPSAGNYVVQDAPTTYGPMGQDGSSTGAYAVNVTAPAGRPAQHWDVTFTESLTGTWATSKSWTVHVGDSFWDVPRSSPFYKKVETLFHSGITAGCASGAFCPDATLSRSDIAVFTARGLSGGGANIPASGNIGNRAYSCASGGESLFLDVKPTDPYCKHFHYLAAQKAMPGCDGLHECPTQLVPRLEMAQTIARAMVAPAGDAGIPTTYGPDPVTGRSYTCLGGMSHFIDVNAANAACRHVNYLWARGVIAGCGPDTFCPGGDVTRGEMAKFLANAFDLKLYGP